MAERLKSGLNEKECGESEDEHAAKYLLLYQK